VFLPISFIPGNVGRLFGEFGISMAAAIGVSALISLTLVPMMSSKIFAGGIIRGRVADAVDRFFRWLSHWYERSVRAALAAPAIVGEWGLQSWRRKDRACSMWMSICARLRRSRWRKSSAAP